MIKFYDYESFIKQKGEDLLQERFAISDDTYRRILKESNISLCSTLLNNRDKFDICHSDNNDILPKDIYLASYYEKLCHPDEVVFVTSDQKMADFANKYFGEDSIILLK